MSDVPSLTVCIPAYDMGGRGSAYLTASFDRLAAQDWQGFDVVVSDQSDTDAVAEVCDAYEYLLRVTRVTNRDGKRQASANVNNAMRHARGDVVKILFQDDLVAAPDALRRTAEAFADPACTWLLCGSAVTRDGKTPERPMVPRPHPQIRFGKNTVSSPSVLAMRRNAALEFDENLIWLMDVEMYHRLHATLGAPTILPETQILNRLHDGQVSSGVTPELRRKELRYVRRKHKAGETLKDRLAFYKQVLKAR